MSDPVSIGSVSPGTPPSAPGELLRQARLLQNLSLDDLAGILKVSAAKLEALEQGRHDSLPSSQFARALAMTVCRCLKLDPAPVLAGLPAATSTSLGGVTPSLNQPFRDFRSTGPLFDRQGGMEWPRLSLRSKWFAPALLVLASLVVWLWPERFEWPFAGDSARTQVAVGASSAVALSPSQNAVASSVVSASVSVSEPPTTADVAGPAASVASAAALAASAMPAKGEVPALVAVSASSAGPALPAPAAARLQLKATESSWIEVRDGLGGVLLGRQVHVGEAVSLEGVPPLKLIVGNASKVQMTFQGQPVDLGPYIKAEVARLELK